MQDEAKWLLHGFITPFFLQGMQIKSGVPRERRRIFFKELELLYFGESVLDHLQVIFESRKRLLGKGDDV